MRWYQLEFFVKFENYSTCNFYYSYIRANTNATAMYRARCLLFRFRKQEEKDIRCGRMRQDWVKLIELTRVVAQHKKSFTTHIYLGEKYTNLPKRC